MRQCLDEAMLQSYFDGELSATLMESATLHLASCAACAAAARELEEENALLSEAFALEFAESVPTERLRTRIDAAVSGLQVVNPVVQQPTVVSGFFASLASFFSFAPQRALGYAALMAVLVFGAILGLVKLNSAPPQNQAQKGTSPTSTAPSAVTPKEQQPESSPRLAVNETPKVVETVDQPIERNQRVAYRQSVSPKRVAPKTEPVKLLPGERAYLQTIAKLDSTIRDDKKSMRPALQVEYERNLAVVDRAIAATRSAAKKNPSDPDAADFMFAAYQSKVDLLNTIADARVYNRTQ
jgi:anti-sigma factor RsiW